MSFPNILQFPHDALRTCCVPVVEFGDPIRKLARDMFTAMRLAIPNKPGVALAANQIGDLRRVLVVDPSGKGLDMRVMVNPVIVKKADSQRVRDGSLSIDRGETFGTTTRAKRVVVEYVDEDGQPKKVKAAGYFAHVLQHGVDQLNGKLWTDLQEVA